LILTRVGGALAFVPIPGFRNTPAVARIVLILAVTLSLLPAWPDLGATSAAFSPFWLLSELALGLTAGVLVAWLNEAFLLAMQILGLQAGYAYASMIDPTTQADSSTLQIIAQLCASLLFFAAGLDRELLRVFSLSLEAHPPGLYRIEELTMSRVIGFTASMLALATRLALPLISLLILVDVALALLGRINASLQMLTLAFPAKMLISMAVLTVLAGLLPSLYENAAAGMVTLLRTTLAGASP